MSNRPLTPLQAMTRNSSERALLNNTKEKITTINPNLITNWQFSDRIEADLGDIEGLAQDFKTIGQQQPCIIRPIKNTSPFKYELIAGERRWRASLLAKLELLVIIKELTDEDAAIIQISENESRKDLSDYAKGMSYARLIQKNVITQKDLIQKLGKSKQYISALLSFSRMPQKIISAIGDMSKVSHRTAEEICRLSNKGENYIEAILLITEKIKTGKYGVESIKKFVIKKVENIQEKAQKHKYYNKHGKLIFSTKETKLKLLDITLSKEVSLQIAPLKSDFLEEILCITDKLLNKSAAAD